jgi:hypothetical protein
LLAKWAACRQSHLAFGAELARVARGESTGAHLAALAPMIKESHRIAMCVELFVPLVRAQPIPADVGPALTVLRGAERHLGRWLVLGEVAVKAGDMTPIAEAGPRADTGPSSARAAWSLVLWALRQTAAASQATAAPADAKGAVDAPQTRPTLELVARLSDRPSADRDTTFLFRMALARAAVAKPMLEALARPLPLGDEVSLRAAMCLARDYGRIELREALLEAALTAKREEVRGLATAALWDACAPFAHDGAPVQDADGAKRYRDRAREIADDLVASKVVGNVAWGVLLRTAARGGNGFGGNDVAPLVTETPFRWIQWGWLE